MEFAIFSCISCAIVNVTEQFIVAHIGDKGSLPFLHLTNPYQIIGAPQVQIS